MAKKNRTYDKREVDKLYDFINNPGFVAGKPISKRQAEGLNAVINFVSILMKHDMDRVKFEEQTETYIKRLLSLNASIASGFLSMFDKLPPEVGNAFFNASTKHIMEDPHLANETQEVLKVMRDKAEKSGDDTEVMDILDMQFKHITDMDGHMDSIIGKDNGDTVRNIIKSEEE
tara:strand:+ start:142 stop:663 length:522 start_codon:yes stop_codon:yes gene_type:complete